MLGYSRQAYYKQIRQQSERLFKTSIIVNSVSQIRIDLPKTGTVKIHKHCQKEWAPTIMRLQKELMGF